MYSKDSRSQTSGLRPPPYSAIFLVEFRQNNLLYWYELHNTSKVARGNATSRYYEWWVLIFLVLLCRWCQAGISLAEVWLYPWQVRRWCQVSLFEWYKFRLTTLSLALTPLPRKINFLGCKFVLSILCLHCGQAVFHGYLGFGIGAWHIQASTSVSWERLGWLSIPEDLCKPFNPKIMNKAIWFAMWFSKCIFFYFLLCLSTLPAKHLLWQRDELIWYPVFQDCWRQQY